MLGDVVSIHYSCLLAHSGTVVDSSRSKPLGTRQPLKVQIGTCQLVRGLEHALLMLSVGTLARVYVPAVLAYADEQVGQIAPGSDLVFEVEMQMIGDKLAPPLPQSHIRERFMLPPSAPPAMTFAQGNVARERGSAINGDDGGSARRLNDHRTYVHFAHRVRHSANDNAARGDI